MAMQIHIKIHSPEILKIPKIFCAHGYRTKEKPDNCLTGFSFRINVTLEFEPQRKN